jgi:6-phosphogluconolactonase
MIERVISPADQLAASAADRIISAAGDAIRARGRFTLALSGGSTPEKTYTLLTSPERSTKLDWSRMYLFFGDERFVPHDDPRSNCSMATRSLFSRAPIDDDHIFRIPTDTATPSESAARYVQTLASFFGVPADGPPPAFDLILLGMGPDAHTASLFPHTQALGVTDRWVVPNYVPKFNTYRLTMTRPMINAARQVLFLVAGPDKANPLFEVFTGPPDSARLPSQLIRPTPGLLVWYADKSAITKLTAGFDGAGGTT